MVDLPLSWLATRNELFSFLQNVRIFWAGTLIPLGNAIFSAAHVASCRDTKNHNAAA
jgi:hypothetical protein